MGLYTLFLFVQTTRYVYYQTSIIDQHKRNMYNARVLREARRNMGKPLASDSDADDDTAESQTMKHHP